jgi:hypothetical protein
MKRTLLALALLFVTIPARADEEEAGVRVRPSLALGVFAFVPTAAGRPADVAFDLEPSLEINNFFLTGVALFNSGSLSDTATFQTWLLGARAGLYFLDGPGSPFFSVGLASLHQALYTPEDGGTQVLKDGAALLCEIGVQFYRRPGFGRLTLAAQLIAPFFSLQTSAYSSKETRIPTLMLGLKLAL